MRSWVMSRPPLIRRQPKSPISSSEIIHLRWRLYTFSFWTSDHASEPTNWWGNTGGNSSLASIEESHSDVKIQQQFFSQGCQDLLVPFLWSFFCHLKHKNSLVSIVKAQVWVTPSISSEWKSISPILISKIEMWIKNAIEAHCQKKVHAECSQGHYSGLKESILLIHRFQKLIFTPLWFMLRVHMR
jgi:hypothetical protein